MKEQNFDKLVNEWMNRIVFEQTDEEIQADIADLEQLAADPDPTRAADYGTVDDYKAVLQKKITELKSQLG